MAYSIRNTSDKPSFDWGKAVILPRLVALIALLSFSVLVTAHAVHVLNKSIMTETAAHRVEGIAALSCAIAVSTLFARGFLRALRRTDS